MKEIVLGISCVIASGIIIIWYLRKRKFRYQPVILCNNASDWINKEKEFLYHFHNATFIGMDCEWVTKGNTRNPVSLLQLATPNGPVILVRLCNMKASLIPCSLTELLSNKNILKVGVGVCEDAHKLLCDYGLVVESCLDLRHLVHNRPEFQNNNNLSLNVISQVILNSDLKKTMALTCSDWESEILTSKQIVYAAEDALAGAQIFEKLFFENKWSHFNVNGQLKKFQKFLNEPFKSKTPPLISKTGSTKNHNVIKLNKSKRLYSKVPVSKVLYENCQLLAPDGEYLCSCDARKALWYASKKSRGEIVSKDPLIVKLNFEPSARPILDDKYYIQEKENSCVVCGSTELLSRKFIVPSEYRKYFPGIMKKNLSHDVLLFCFPCHRKSNIFYEKFREELAKECDAPIGSELYAEMKVNNALVKIKSAAKALLTSGSKIPEKRQLELKEVISKHFEVDEVTDDLIKEASSLNCFHENDKFIIHGQKVYEHMCKHGGLMAFETRWRQYFLDTMKPKFLPNMWSVNHNHENLTLKVLRKEQDFDISILGLSDELIERAKKLNG